MIGLEHFLIVSALLFGIGLYGLVSKRNVIALLMSIELMLNAVNINLVAFSRFVTPDKPVGQVFALFTIALAAAEVAVGLALVFRIYHDHDTVEVDQISGMKG